MFKNVFNYETLNQMLEYLHSLKTTDNYNQGTSFIEDSFEDFGNKVKVMSKSDKKQRNKYTEYCL